MSDDRERESLKDEVNTAIEEARMVLPGIQALFGFQLIAVFNNRFESLGEAQQVAHLVSIALIVLSIGAMMAPAAFHRIGERGWVSRRLIDLTPNFLTAGMSLLVGGISIEVGLVAELIVHRMSVAIGLAIATAIVLYLMWLVLPVIYRRKHRPPRS